MGIVGTAILVIAGISAAGIFLKCSVMGFVYVWVCSWTGYWSECFDEAHVSHFLCMVDAILGLPGAVLAFIVSIPTLHFLSWF